ncbi:MAG: proline--tRNA ligase [Parcubacteria group bacterium]|nr:proline--tRNA ligase [Parcubacteria group bacterium]
MSKFITPKSENFSEWYNDVVLKAELADYAPVKGCMVIRPYGYALWEHIQYILDKAMKTAGVQNAYFPLFIPEEFLKREKDHVEGFSPELAVVTIGGGKELQEKLVVRPTSETIMYAMYAKWIHSWRDLPVKINQWNNVVRWEKRTYLFLRTTEFLWQEGHTAHATHEEALKEVQRALALYDDFYKNYAAVYGIAGKKSDAEKFAGAKTTYAYEIVLPDGKILQGCTSHDLGQNFSKVFNISFLDQEGVSQFAWQTSWGLSTRSIGGIVMAHGDDKGLLLPPKIAPTQIIIVPIFGKDEKVKEHVSAYVEKVRGALDGYRVEVDLSNQTPGWKFNQSELRGIPIRLEIGPKEMDAHTAIAVRRDDQDEIAIPFTELSERIGDILDDIHLKMLERTKQFTEKNTHRVDAYVDFKKIMKTKRGFLSAFWCEDQKCEAMIKEETKATTRCLPLDAKKEEGICIRCDKKASYRWLFGQAY